MIPNTETQSHRVFIFCKTYPHGVTELFPRVRRSRELRVPQKGDGYLHTRLTVYRLALKKIGKWHFL